MVKRREKEELEVRKIVGGRWMVVVSSWTCHSEPVDEFTSVKYHILRQAQDDIYKTPHPYRPPAFAFR